MTKQIKKTELKKWLQEISKKRRVIAPQRNGAEVYFDVFDKSKELALDELPFIPAKAVLLPPSESLFKFKCSKSGVGNEQITIKASDDLAETFLFGVMLPDLQGLATLDYAFSNHYKDPYYLRRREKTVLLACLWHPEHEACFCDVFSPSLSGADIAMDDGGEFFYLYGLTDKGSAFLSSSKLEESTKTKEEIKSACSCNFVPALGSAKFDISGIEDKIDRLFTSKLWLDLTRQCIGCGICTYVCPTCYCFDMFDEGCGDNCGERRRTWDTCQEAKFTLEASGHNPRKEQFQRYRNRIYHKFRTLKDKTGSYSCTGCGRCVKYCPVGVDIRKIIRRICQE